MVPRVRQDGREERGVSDDVKCCYHDACTEAIEHGTVRCPVEAAAHELAALRWWVGEELQACGWTEVDGEDERYAEYNDHRATGPTLIAAIIALYDKVVGR